MFSWQDEPAVMRRLMYPLFFSSFSPVTSEVLSAVEAAGLLPEFFHRVHGSRSDANAPDNVWLTVDTRP